MIDLYPLFFCSKSLVCKNGSIDGVCEKRKCFYMQLIAICLDIRPILDPDCSN